MKRTIIALSVLVFISCNSGKEKEVEIPKEGSKRLVGVWIKPDSTRQLDILLMQIRKVVKYDSAKKIDRIVYDTAVGFPIIVPLVDSLGRAIFDSVTKKPKVNPQPQYILISKDSVNFNVAYVSVDSLLKKK